MNAKLAIIYLSIIILIAVFTLVVTKYFKDKIKIIIIITLPMLVFIELCEDLIQQELLAFDNTIYIYISRFISEGTTEFMTFLSFLGSGQVLVFITIASLFTFWKNKKLSFYSKMLTINLAASSALNLTLKLIFHRARPDILRLAKVSGFSFPSGHSMVSMCFYGFIAYYCYKNIKNYWRYLIPALVSVLILLIGISRIYLGVHYASDVLAGFTSGLAWLAIFIVLTNKVYVLKNKTSKLNLILS